MLDYNKYVFSNILINWINTNNMNMDELKNKQMVIIIGGRYNKYLKYINIANDEFYKLIEMLNIKLFYTIDAKGILDEQNKNVIGYYWGGITNNKHLEMINKSKLILFMGVELCDYTSAGYSCLLKVDYSINSKNISYKNQYQNKNNMIKLDKISKIIIKSIENNINMNTDIFVETGSSWFYGVELKLPTGCKFNISIKYGSIGWCFPSSIGNSFANPLRKTLCITGDGAFQMVMQELLTAIKYDINMTLLIINNNMYQIENALDNEKYNELPEVNYLDLMKSFGCKKVCYCDENKLDMNLNKCMNEKGFNVIILKQNKNEIDNFMKHWAILQSKCNVKY